VSCPRVARDNQEKPVSSFRILAIALGAWILSAPSLAYEGDGVIEKGEDPTLELARATQNAVADMISLPIEYTSGYNFGPRDRTRHVVEIKPVIPLTLNDDWKLITRTIFPIVSQPSFAPKQDRNTGTGDTLFTLYASPEEPLGGRLIWGAGPVTVIPTASDDRLGDGKWGAGLSAVGLVMAGPVVAGALVSNIWNLEGNDDYSRFTFQYFLSYNLSNGWYLSSAPLITADWEGPHDAWTVPVGGGVGKVTYFGEQPINIAVEAFYNVEKPAFGPDWSTRFRVQLLFPK
jgi:hypothetical protein